MKFILKLELLVARINSTQNICMMNSLNYAARNTLMLINIYISICFRMYRICIKPLRFGSLSYIKFYYDNNILLLEYHIDEKICKYKI